MSIHNGITRIKISLDHPICVMQHFCYMFYGNAIFCEFSGLINIFLFMRKPYPFWLVVYCCWFLKIAYLWSTCLSADCSVYCHKTTERKSLRAPSLESRVLWAPVIKTMVIISEYTLTYKADSGVFCYEQWCPPCLPRLWRYFEVPRYQTTYPEEGRRRKRVSYDP